MLLERLCSIGVTGSRDYSGLMIDPSTGKAAKRAGKAAERDSDILTSRVPLVGRLVAYARARAQTVTREAEKTIADCYAEAEQHGWLSAEAAEMEAGKRELPAPEHPGQQGQPADAKASLPPAETNVSPTT
ncbi:MAG: hypothetical protein QOE58_1606 [Actinomycetota bacterium]|jgi:hypothetical protein|nr:hypothetical protein [Actinomycetota bacterium]